MRPTSAVYRWRRAGLALMAAALTLGGFMISSSDEDAKDPPRPAAADAFNGPADTAGTASSLRALPLSPPKRIQIPSIGVDAPLIGLNADKDGTLEPPPGDKKNLAGWFRNGIPPGSTGTAVIAGHVDTREGPAIFYNLGSLHKDNTVKITRADGYIATFVVDAVEEYEKDDFPSDKVYGHATRPELRLITCSGSYSEKNGYSANAVAYAHLDKVSPASAE
ncbi:class F sortase [Streptomyces sp. A5-4]|uniref:class F sortase n=1 Tax=Streptomyces sp. A5-4 TaxID=3384771 RepID=UPI003DAA0B0A